MKQYKILQTRLSEKKTEEELNNLSKEGWEILSRWNNGHWIVLFKEIN